VTKNGILAELVASWESPGNVANIVWGPINRLENEHVPAPFTRAAVQIVVPDSVTDTTIAPLGIGDTVTLKTTLVPKLLPMLGKALRVVTEGCATVMVPLLADEGEPLPA
jgi:hypothetical protein